MAEITHWRREAKVFCTLAALGVVATAFHVKIPNTEALIEIRWAFGFLGFVLLRHRWTAGLLAGLLSMPIFSTISFIVGFSGNMTYALPCLVVLRGAHHRYLVRLSIDWSYAAIWFLLVLFCYQAFNTPVVWGVTAIMQDMPVWPALLDGWRTQPFLVESFLVGIVSAAGLLVVRSHEKLKQSRRELAITLDAIGDGVIATNADGRVVRMNPVARKLTGWPLEEALGRPLGEIFRIFNTLTLEPADNPVKRVIREGVVVGLANHTTLEARNGSRRQIADSAAPIFESDDRLVGAVMVFRDVTEEYETRALLQKKDELLSKSQALAHIGSWELNGATNQLRWSDEVYRIFGLSPQEFKATYESFLEFVHPDDRSAVDEAYSGSIRGRRDSYEIEHRIVRKDSGEVRIVQEKCEHEWGADGTFVRSLGLVQDITERKQAEKNLQQMEKMESIGRLAGGVAHDLNNLLSPIIGYSELLIEDPQAEVAYREFLQEIVSAGYRARDLVRQLLAFSRRQPLEFKSVNINKVLEGFEKLLRRTLRENIDVHIALAENLPSIRADAGQIEQVIMNLAINAQDAMPSGGTLTLESAVVELDEDYARKHTSASPGRYVMLVVTDTGNGMDESTLERLFEPFFTTKEKGKGTGLGLATVYGIVKQHGGNIWVYSEPGRGAAFKCYFPAAESFEHAPEERVLKAPPVDLRGDETLMVVEDNDAVRKMVVSTLAKRGYLVLSAGDGKSSLDLLRTHDGPIDLLFTDVVMPDMNGKELFTTVQSNFPDIKVIYTSGYTDNVIAHHGVLDEGVDFIQKPFSVNALVHKVREVLDR